MAVQEMPTFKGSNGAFRRRATPGLRRFVDATALHFGFRWMVNAASGVDLLRHDGNRIEENHPGKRAVCQPSSRIPVALPSMLNVFLRFQYSLTPSGPISS